MGGPLRGSTGTTRGSSARWLGLTAFVTGAAVASCDAILGIGNPVVGDASSDATRTQDAGHGDVARDSGTGSDSGLDASGFDSAALNGPCANLYACCAATAQPAQCEAIAEANVAKDCVVALAVAQGNGECLSGSGTGSATGSGTGTGAGGGSGNGSGTGKGSGSGSAGGLACKGPEQCPTVAEPACCGASTSADAGACAGDCSTGMVPRCASATDCAPSLVCCIPISQSYGSCIAVADCAGLVNSSPHLPHFALCNIKTAGSCTGGTCEVATCTTGTGQTELTVCSTCTQGCTVGCSSPACPGADSCCGTADGGATCATACAL